ncbi:MAG: hypothetical protein AB1425_18405 [Actinomycetota bacterium]
MWTTQESLTLLALSLLLGGTLILAYFFDRIRAWWRRRREGDR